MIRGYFRIQNGSARPFIDATFQFAGVGIPFEVKLLVDTGADRTILAPNDADRLEQRFGIRAAALPTGVPSRGVGGQTVTRAIDTTIALEAFSAPLSLTILEPRAPLLPIPSLLGRDILSRFAVIIEQRTGRALLLDPAEADALHLP